MSANKTNLHRLWDCGQSPWLDDISKCLLQSGQLRKMVYEDGIRGVTTNPTIFEKAISSGDCGYPLDIRGHLARGLSAVEAYEALSAHDVRSACDILRELYDSSSGLDGFVSWEEAPEWAFSEDKTISEALRLAKIIDRPNVFIKIPSTPQGIRALRQVTRTGISVNMTLIFSIEQYTEVAASYIAGLEDRLADGNPIDSVRSVASVFVSRIDAAADKALAAHSSDPTASALRGRIAIANTKLTYQEYLRLFKSPRFAALAKRGGQVQRPLWASTGVKDPSYSDTMYIDELIGGETVNTIPGKTIIAFQDHGTVVRDAILIGVDQAKADLAQFSSLGISINDITDKLLADGVTAFADSFNQLIKTIHTTMVEAPYAR